MKIVTVNAKHVCACFKKHRLDMLTRLVKKAKLSYCQIDAWTEIAFCIKTKERYYLEHNGGTYPTQWNLIKETT